LEGLKEVLKMGGTINPKHAYMIQTFLSEGVGKATVRREKDLEKCRQIASGEKKTSERICSAELYRRIGGGGKEGWGSERREPFHK